MSQNQNSDSSKKIMRDIVPRIEKEADAKKLEREEFFKKLADLKKQDKQISALEKEKTVLEQPLKEKIGFSARFKKIKQGGKKMLFIAAGLFIFIFAALFYFLTPATSAVIKITPASKTVSLNAFLKGAETGGDIPFSLLKLSMEKEGKIKAASVSFMEKKASGVIVIYNGYSAVPQTLVKNTRFETSEGKIYRIDKNIVVPGAKTVNKKLIPGSAEATVYADKPGGEYNIEFSDFTIPGFRGTAKYDKFYARSKTIMKDGFSGNVPKADEKYLKELSERLRKEIEGEILAKAFEEIGKDEILLKDGTELNFYSESSGSYDSEYAILKERADFIVPVFKKEDISAYLASKYVSDDFKQNVNLENFEKLGLETLKKDLILNKEITFKIYGDAVFRKNIDAEKIKGEIVLVKDIQYFFRGKPEVSSAEIVLRPIFKNKLPKNPSSIKIEIIEITE